MRLQGILPALLLTVFAGCSCCPNYYGPGLGPQPYGTCVGTQTIAPPLPMAGSGGRRRSTIAERKQARDMQRWYRELNDEPRGRASGHDDFCPHCQRKGRPRRTDRFDDYYDDTAYYDDGMVYDGFYDGQIIDGGMMDSGSFYGSHTNGICASCQDQHQYDMQPQYNMQPMQSESMMVPQPQPTPSGEPAPAPPAEPVPTPTDAGTPAAFLNEIYSPAPLQQGQPQQVNIPPVEQVLYAPSGAPRQ